MRSRRPRTGASYALGWLAVLIVVTLGRPEGDFALVSDLEGYALLFAGFPLVFVGVLSLAAGTAPRGGGAAR
jgi:hypothetical protein